MKTTLLLLLATLFSLLSAHEKWIIVTTIQHPTPQMQALAKIEGWQLLVVGDRKTPPDWSLDGAIYLSPAEQEKLPYELAHLLPWNHYGRKMVGYLYAIDHGAKIIYETDDDNERTQPLEHSLGEQRLPQVTSGNGCVNIYAYFERPDVWPRGFPLNEIATSKEPLLLPATGCRVALEQGVVDKDPDVDAIFRLTRPQEVYFTPKTPCYLPAMSFCPINTQNTFIAEEAFYTLYLPTTVTMRVCDIWHGYIAQRLLWEEGSVVAFSGPNAVQERNEHNFLNDFQQEARLYTQAGLLINFLKSWQATSHDPLANLVDL